MKNKALIPNRKYYIVVAINKNDPTDILGYVENSFSMRWSKYFVNLYSGYKLNAIKKATKRWLDDSTVYNYDDKKFSDWFKQEYSNGSEILYKDGMTVKEMRKVYENHIFEIEKKSLGAQNNWNICGDKLWAPKNYDIKAFRVNSKYCPVEVDLRYRISYDRRLTKDWDKWKYRNAFFFVKELNLDKTIYDFNKDINSILKFPVSQIKFKEKDLYLYVKPTFKKEKLKKSYNSEISKKYKTRSQWKLEKKQKENSKKNS